MSALVYAGSMQFMVINLISAVTVLLRFLPFWVFGGRKTPAFITYLSKVLPYAVMAMPVVYCLKDLSLGSTTGWVPYVAGVGATVGVHVWKRNSIFSILAGRPCIWC